MMKVNFFAMEHRREPIKQDSLLGICDPEGEKYAYTTSDKNCTDKWCATIHNPHRKGLLFIAVDKNIEILRPNGEQENRCDGMIYVPATKELSFVELKDSRTAYVDSAEKQLLKTLEYFLANHNYKDYNNRRAFACNPSHPHFAVSARNRISEFYRLTHFRLMPQAIINF